MTGYDWHVIRDIPPAHGSGKEPMYAGLGKSIKPDPNRKIEYPRVLHVLCIDSHNTSFFYEREDGTYLSLRGKISHFCSFPSGENSSNQTKKKTKRKL